MLWLGHWLAPRKHALHKISEPARAPGEGRERRSRIASLKLSETFAETILASAGTGKALIRAMPFRHPGCPTLAMST